MQNAGGNCGNDCANVCEKPGKRRGILQLHQRPDEKEGKR